MTLDEALRVLGTHWHRGCPAWEWDAGIMRAVPSVWAMRGGEACPELTRFELVCIARGLASLSRPKDAPAHSPGPA